jgi:5-methylcytosine-specific restriction protein A
MKLGNFRRWDPSYQGKGLVRGNRLEREVWDEFAERPEELHRVADAIRNGYTAPEAAASSANGDEEEEFPEGRVLYRLQKARERNRKLVQQAKQKAKEKHGRLECVVCDFDFAAVYGKLGEDFIECHHTTPLSGPESKRATRLSEVALVCSNCHRMLHRKRPWLGIDELTSLLRK